MIDNTEDKLKRDDTILEMIRLENKNQFKMGKKDIHHITVGLDSTTNYDEKIQIQRNSSDKPAVIDLGLRKLHFHHEKKVIKKDPLTNHIEHNLEILSNLDSKLKKAIQVKELNKR